MVNIYDPVASGEKRGRKEWESALWYLWKDVRGKLYTPEETAARKDRMKQDRKDLPVALAATPAGVFAKGSQAVGTLGNMATQLPWKAGSISRWVSTAGKIAGVVWDKLTGAGLSRGKKIALGAAKLVGAAGVTWGTAYVSTKDYEPKSDEELRDEIAGKEPSAANPDDIGMGQTWPWGVQTNFTDPTPPVTQEENKGKGDNQIKDDGKQTKRDEQQLGWADASAGYNPNTENVDTSNNSLTAPTTGWGVGRTEPTTDTPPPTSTTQETNVATTPEVDINASQWEVQDAAFTSEGWQYLNYKADEWKVEKFNAQLQQEVQLLRDEWYDDTAIGEYVNNRMATVNDNLAQLWREPLPTPEVGGQALDENYTSVEWIQEALNENYLWTYGEQLASVSRTQDEQFDAALNSLGTPDYVFNKATGNYEVKTMLQVWGGDEVTAASLLNSFDTNKKAGSWTGIAQEFGISSNDLNQFIDLVLKDYSWVVPTGIAKMNTMIGQINDAMANGNTAMAQDLYAQLKMWSWQVSNLITNDMIKTAWWNFDSLWNNSAYNLAKKIQSWAVKVRTYYDKGYSDIKAEAMNIAKPEYKMGYVDIENSSTKNKWILRDNPTYQHYLNTYAATDEIAYKQLTADYYGNSSITDREKDFLRKINDEIYKPMKETYNNLKQSMTSAEAKAMLPGYDEIGEMINISYRSQFDDHLDALTTGMDMGLTWLGSSTTLLMNEPEFSRAVSGNEMRNYIDVGWQEANTFNPQGFTWIE